MKPEDAAQFQQKQLADLALVPSVAAATRAAFERLRRVHAQGVLLYDLYTLVADQGYLSVSVRCGIASCSGATAH
jgi:hypothetical protein